MNQHGSTSGNAEVANMVIRHAIARNVDPKGDLLIDMGTDEEREIVVVWPTNVATPGTTTIRIYKNGSACSFHVGAALEQSPSLRPLAKKTRCVVTEEVDEQNLPIMVIATKAGKATTTQSRDSGQSSSGSPSTPGSPTTPGSQAAATEGE